MARLHGEFQPGLNFQPDRVTRQAEIYINISFSSPQPPFLIYYNLLTQLMIWSYIIF